MMNSLSVFDNFDKMLDDAFKGFNFGFGLPRNLRFNTMSTKDQMPAFWRIWKDEEGNMNGYSCIVRSVGVDPNDMTVELSDNGIIVDGKTVIDEDTEYSQHVELPISKDIIGNIEEITYRCKDGLTYIYIKVNTPERKKVLAKRIEG